MNSPYFTSSLPSFALRHTGGPDGLILTLNRYELRAAREWLADCAGTADVAEYWLSEQEGGANDRQVTLTVGRHYAGGLAAFKRTVNAGGSK